MRRLEVAAIAVMILCVAAAMAGGTSVALIVVYGVSVAVKGSIDVVRLARMDRTS